jgi:hypothetical protein
MYIVWIDRLCRWHRKLAKGKESGSVRRITVFVRHENVVRLLGSLATAWSSYFSVSLKRP